MDHKILKKYMMQFSTEELKHFLGTDLVDSLLEWNTENEAFASKSRLSDMILCVHGLSILKNKDFRLRLLKSLPPQEILDFKVDLSTRYSNCEDLNVLVEAISNTSWKESDINRHLLRLLAYSEDEVFEKKDQSGEAEEEIVSNEKFYELLDYQYIIRQKALNVLNSDYGLRRFLIHMPTGTGKTKTAIHIVCHHYNYNLHKKGLILWVAHTTELLEQAFGTFCGVWRNIGNGSIHTYKLRADYNIEILKDGFNGFMVCGIQKLQAIQNSNVELFQSIVREIGRAHV